MQRGNHQFGNTSVDVCPPLAREGERPVLAENDTVSGEGRFCVHLE